MDMLESPLDIGNLLDGTLINSVLQAAAMSIRWYPARRCSCWGEIEGEQVASGSPDPECPICKGLGRLYSTYHDITGVVLQGMENMANWDESGVNYNGVITMICPYVNNSPLAQLYTQGSLNDLIWAEDIVLSTRTMIIRGEDETRERPIGEVSITSGESTYTQYLDFRMDGKQVNWLPDKGPPTGQRYEATYQYHPWFSIMFGMPIARNFSHLNLPRSFVLQLTPEYGEDFISG